MSVLSIAQFGGRGDGVTDNTSAVRAMLNASSAGDTLYFPAGTYLTDQFKPKACCTITGDGMGATILKALPGAHQSTIIWIDGVNGVKVSRLSIDGNRFGLGQITSVCNGCILVSGSNHIVSEVELMGSEFSGIWLGASTDTPENFLLKDCFIHDNGSPTNGNGVGIFIGGPLIPRNIKILNSTWTHNHALGDSVGDSTAINIQAYQCIIANNYFADNYNKNGAQVAVTDGGDGLKEINATINGNLFLVSSRFKDDMTDGIEIHGRNFVVSGNVVQNYASSAVGVVGRAGYGTVTGNTFLGGSIGVLMLDQASNVLVASNLLNGAPYPATSVTPSKTAKVRATNGAIVKAFIQ